MTIWIQSMQSHIEVQKCSGLSDHLNYNMLKDYMGILAWWRQKLTAYPNLSSQKDVPSYRSKGPVL